MARFRVYTLDVWGNENDGWEVNDRRMVGVVGFDENASDADIWAALVEADIAVGPFERASFDSSDGDFICINDAKRSDRPVFQLERDYHTVA